jgi:hypothetical protein
MKKTICRLALMAALTLIGSHALAESGSIKLQHAGPLAFAPDGVLLIGDTAAATLYAVETKDTKALADKGRINLKQVNSKIAAALGTSADNILINDMTVNPLSGKAYLSVSRGTGPDAMPVVLTISPSGDIAELSLNDVAYTKAALPNAPAKDATDSRGRSTRQLSITDMSYHNGKVVIAGLSNEEFASNLRMLDFPFKSVNKGTAVEIYHGNHGAWETRSPVSTFTTVNIDGTDYVIAAYTCTPLVLFPMDALKDTSKVNGITVAELGARNRPLDMFVYGEPGNQSILMSNSTYGIMKISMKDITKADAITARVGGTAGQEFETIEELKGVVQLAQVGNGALAIIYNEGSLDLRSIDLP